MRSLLRLIVPRRIGTQIALLVVTAIVLAHVAITTSFLVFEHGRRPEPRLAEIEHLAFAARLAETGADASARAGVLAAARRADPSLIVLSRAPAPYADSLENHLLHDIQAHLGGPPLYAARDPGNGGDERLAIARLSDGSALAVPFPHPPRLPFLSPAVFGSVAFLASALVLLSLWAARQLASPLARFADAAEGFTAKGHSTPLAETGPLEVRRAARALNEMQASVLKLIEDRTRMLAAVSHDLRTPITRLRLRAEDVTDAALREPILRDLATMENLVRSALWFLRGELDPAPLVIADLPPLVQTVCDDFTDASQSVHYAGPDHLYVRCDPDQLMRAIQNLIDNGLKFGTAVDVRVVREDRTATIEVKDNGPGIPDAEKERVLEPFYRGDSARNLNDGDSFGLGLSIAQSIVAQNGGRLELRDALPSGLIARIVLAAAR